MADLIIPTVTKGHYIWDDNNKCLEFVSNDASYEAKTKKKKGRNATGGPRMPTRAREEVPSFMPFSTTMSVGLPSLRGGARTIGPPRGSPKLGVSDHYSTTVTLKDVKEVALDHLQSDMELNDAHISIPFNIPSDESKMTVRKSLTSDRGEKRNASDYSTVSYKRRRRRCQKGAFVRHLMDTPEFDEFLIAFLHYFTCFFDQLEQELKPHKTSFLEPSKAELQALADTKKKMEVTRRKLGQSYCVLILGLGNENQHHMGCGKKRVSNSHRDKKLFEDMYLFCTYVVWVTFRRKEFERVKIEVGNMLRSEVFNPALKQKIKATVTAEARKENQKKAKTEPPKPEITLPEQKNSRPKPPGQRAQELLAVQLPKMERLTPAQHRRIKGNAPAIGTAVYQRSTVLVSLLPLPKEESDYLFGPLVGRQRKKVTTEEDLDEIGTDYMPQKIGIIGEQTDLFNMANLMPKNMENEDDNESTDDANARERNSSSTSDRRASREGDAISRVTTAE